MMSDIQKLFEDAKKRADKVLCNYIASKYFGAIPAYSKEEFDSAIEFMRSITPPLNTEEE